MRLRTLELPVLRLHSDRAREFTGVKLRDWCTQRDILQTSTAGDESAGNGRCESEFAIIQAQLVYIFVQLDWKLTGGLWL